MINTVSIRFINHNLYTPPVIDRYAKKLNIQATIARRLMIGSPRVLRENTRKRQTLTSNSRPVQY